MPPSPFSALPPLINARRCTSMHFEENQLSRGLISLSLLPSAHPRIFQHSPVRSFTQYHLRFNLAKGRSPPLRVHLLQLDALFGLAFASPPFRKNLGLPHILTRRLIKQKARPHRSKPALTPCRHTVSGSISLRSQRFFSPFPRGTCSLSVTSEYLALRSGLRGFMRSSTCAVLLRNTLGSLRISITGVSPSVPELSISFTYRPGIPRRGPTTPGASSRFGLFRFRSPLLTESIFFLFLRLLRCFTSPGIAYLSLTSLLQLGWVGLQERTMAY